MKKKTITMIVTMCIMAVTLVGCGSSKELSNEFYKVSQYKDLEVTKVEETKVTDEDVETQIQTILTQNATLVDVTGRPVQTGDTAVIDFTGYIDGEAFDGGSGEGTQLEIGSNSFIEGFEEGIIGHNIGDNFDLNLTFPEDYHSADYAGKAVVFNVTVQNIKESQGVELTDEFVQTVSTESKTVEEFRKEIKTYLEEQSKSTTDAALLEEIWAELTEKTEQIKEPTEEIDKIVKEIKEYYESSAQSYGMEYADFLTSYLGMTEEEFNKQAKEVAETTVKKEMIIEMLADKEDLGLSDEKYKEKYKELAEEYGSTDVDAFIEQYTEETLKKYVLQDLVEEWLVDNCKQVEKKEASTDK